MKNEVKLKMLYEEKARYEQASLARYGEYKPNRSSRGGEFSFDRGPRKLANSIPRSQETEPLLTDSRATEKSASKLADSKQSLNRISNGGSNDTER